MRFIRWFQEIGAGDVASVGGKNASLGEMTQELSSLGIRVPPGFAVTAEAYRLYLSQTGIGARLTALMAGRRRGDDADLRSRAEAAQALFQAPIPHEISTEIIEAYRALSPHAVEDGTAVAVRSSATAEDLPTASFAGQQDSFLNVRGPDAVVDAVRKAFASLYGARAIHYREDMGFSHEQVALSAGVQRMVRSDLGASGVVFTLEPESGHSGITLVSSAWGLGEALVQGRVVPDQFYVHKEALSRGFASLFWRRIGAKERKAVLADVGGVTEVEVPPEERIRPSLVDDEVLSLARSAAVIEAHYSRRAGRWTPMDIEWAKDGRTGELFIVQARPETVHAGAGRHITKIFHLDSHGDVLVRGAAVGESIATGPVRVLRSTAQAASFSPGSVLVTESTDPDWEPLMKRASAIVTEHGGRTSHAAIVARELGIPAVVGAAGALSMRSGEAVTVSCAEGATGVVYRGTQKFHVESVDLEKLPRPLTKLLVNIANPERAFGVAQLPSDGVGLARMEFIFASWVGVHPLALTRYDTLDAEAKAAVDKATGGARDKRAFFVDRLAEGIGTIAAAFHPRPVLLRFSDFKTNEYARLAGGAAFEPAEENPMLGWRGASRYYHPGYREGFRLEVAAVRRVRDLFGLRNLMVMVPFCRTPEEGRRVLAELRDAGLERGRDGLEVHVMAEIPSNILLAEQFARDFDGFSIGSNDLTQLTLGIDRDSATIAPLFDERNEAVLWSCAHLIEVAHRQGRHVGICGQAPSDHPDYAAFLVGCGIDSISVTPDALLRTLPRIAEAERTHRGEAPEPRPHS